MNNYDHVECSTCDGGTWVQILPPTPMVQYLTLVCSCGYQEIIVEK